MRTTVTFDPDVAAQIEQLRAKDQRSFKQVVNDLMRAGLASESLRSRRVGPFTRVVDLGTPLLPDMDDISEVIAIAEGEDHH